MYNSLERLRRLIARFKYPVSLPQDVAEALGFNVSNFLSFDDFIHHLSTSKYYFSNLSKFMPRREAEAAFKRATRIEHFGDKTLISFFFPKGWLEFVLKFDRESRLRRIYLNHKGIENEEGLELFLGASYVGHRKLNALFHQFSEN